MSAANDKNCVVVTCRINGKDISGAGIFGILISVVDEELLIYSGTYFRHEQIDDSLSLPEMVSLIDSERPNERPEELANFETSLDDYIRTSRLFQSEKNLNDPKSIEHKITYFCTSVMSFNAITFLDVGRMSKRELSQIIPSLKIEDKENTGEKVSSDGFSEDTEGAPSNVAVMCDPVMDPVRGVAVANLEVGTMIYCKLREGSVFYNMMEKVLPDFEGTVTGDVTAISINEIGTATVAVKLSDDMTGAIKVPENVRLKLAAKPEGVNNVSHRVGIEVVFAVAGVIIFLCLMTILLNYLQ